MILSTSLGQFGQSIVLWEWRHSLTSATDLQKAGPLSFSYLPTCHWLRVHKSRSSIKDLPRFHVRLMGWKAVLPTKSGNLKRKYRIMRKGCPQQGEGEERDNYVQLRTCCGVWNFMMAWTLVNSPWRLVCMDSCYFKAAGLVKVVEGWHYST